MPEVISDIPTAITIGSKYIYWLMERIFLGTGGTPYTGGQFHALTAVAGATAEHVLTKDTVSGNAIFKVANWWA